MDDTDTTQSCKRMKTEVFMSKQSPDNRFPCD